MKRWKTIASALEYPREDNGNSQNVRPSTRAELAEAIKHYKDCHETLDGIKAREKAASDAETENSAYAARLKKWAKQSKETIRQREASLKTREKKANDVIKDAREARNLRQLNARYISDLKEYMAYAETGLALNKKLEGFGLYLPDKWEDGDDGTGSQNAILAALGGARAEIQRPPKDEQKASAEYDYTATAG